MVGLGKMGASMTLRLCRGGHHVVIFDVNPDAVSSVTELTANATRTNSLEDLVSKLEPPRAVWVMVPSGEITDSTIDALSEYLDEGDIIIDGGNSRYTHSMDHAAALKKEGIGFVDSGTSGGIWGLEEGFCLMIGAEPADYERLEPIFATLAPADGYARVGSPGAGHFTKMVHNGIEYALMEAYGEGFDILAKQRFRSEGGRDRRGVATWKCCAFLAARSGCERAREGSWVRAHLRSRGGFRRGSLDG